MRTLPRSFILYLGVSFLLSSCSALPRSWTRKTHFESADLLSENPVYQVQAIRAAVDSRDQAQLPVLLQLMLEGEPSVRENAYWGMTQLTGLNSPPGSPIEYHSYDSGEERRVAVHSWRSYLNSRSQQPPSESPKP